MDRTVETLLERASRWDAGPPRSGETAALFEALRPLGVTFLATRTYARPDGAFDANALWRAGGFVESFTPFGWIGSREHAYVCVGDNPLIVAPQRRLRAFMFSDFAPKAERRFGPYWDAWGRIGTADGLGLMAHRADGRTASLSIGFADLGALSPAQRHAIRLVGAQLVDRLAPPAPGPLARLTPREREAMALVARGFTDGEIAAALATSATTARAHVDNARRKLGAKTRAQAAAVFVRRESAWD